MALCDFPPQEVAFPTASSLFLIPAQKANVHVCADGIVYVIATLLSTR